MNCNICTDKKKKKEQASTVSFDMCLIWANRLFHILNLIVLNSCGICRRKEHVLECGRK